MALLSLSAQAQVWDGSESSDWFVGDNWFGGAVPDGTGDIWISTTGTNPVVISDVDNNGTATGRVLHIGDGGNAADFTIEYGGIFSSVIDPTLFTNINVFHGSTATVTGVNRDGLEDRRSTLLTGSGLYVGREGLGSLNVLDGGYVEAGRLADTGITQQQIFIGLLGGGKGYVTVSGVNREGVTEYRSTLASRNDMSVGVDPWYRIDVVEGNLSVLDGGLVTVVDKFSVADTTNSIGNVLISGINTEGDFSYRSTLSVETSVTIGGAIYSSRISPGGTAVLTLADGGLLGVGGGSGPLFIGWGATSDGTFNIGAASGETPVDPGILSASGIGFGDGIGKLVFNHADDTGTYFFTQDIATSGSGTHSILHENGYTIFTGDLSSYLGPIDVDGGILGGNITTGGSLAINSGGTLAPGESIGTVTSVDATFESGSTYEVEVNLDGKSDLVHATNEATINGGIVNVTGSYLADFDYLIVTADIELNGVFDDLTGVTDTLFLEHVLLYDDNNAYFRANQLLSFCDVAVTFNQQSVACVGLESLPTSNEVVQAILALTDDDEAQDAFDQLSGEIHASLQGALIEDGQKKVRAVNDRMRAALENATEASSTSAFGGLSSLADGENGFWLTGYGHWIDVDVTSNTAQMDAQLGGVVFGIDREVADNWRFGLLGGYTQTDATQDDRSSTANADTWSVGLYGGHAVGPTHISFGGIYNWHSVDSARTVSFTGFSDYLTASYDAHSWQAFIEAGHQIQINGFEFEPFAGLSTIGIETDAFTETGGSAALTNVTDSDSTTFTTLGVRSAFELGQIVRASGMVGWRHAFGDVDPSSTFTLSGSSAFTVLGAPVAEDAFVTELGLEAEMSPNASLAASYSGQFANGATDHGFNVGFRARF